MSSHSRIDPAKLAALKAKIKADCVARRESRQQRQKELLTPEVNNFKYQQAQLPRHRKAEYKVVTSPTRFRSAVKSEVAISETESIEPVKPSQVPHHMARITALANRREEANFSDETAKIFDSQGPPRAFRHAKVRPRVRSAALPSTTVQPRTAQEIREQPIIEADRLVRLYAVEKRINEVNDWRTKHYFLQNLRNLMLQRRSDPKGMKESSDSELPSYGTISSTYCSERSSLLDRSTTTEARPCARNPKSPQKKIERNDLPRPSTPTQSLEDTEESTLLMTATVTLTAAVDWVKPKAKSLWTKTKGFLQEACTWTSKAFSKRAPEQVARSNAEMVERNPVEHLKSNGFSTAMIRNLFPGLMTQPAPHKAQCKPVLRLPNSAPPAAPSVTEEDSRVDLDLSVLVGFPAFHPPEPAGRPAYYQKRRALNFDEFQKVGYQS